jgi:hypothetical protein
MITRRDWLGIAVGAGASLGATPRLLAALQAALPQGQLLSARSPRRGSGFR